MQKDFSNALTSLPFLLGQVTDTSISQIDSCIAEGPILFGQPVILGTLDRERGVLPHTTSAPTTTNPLIGIAVRSNFANFGAKLASDDSGDQAVIVNSKQDGYETGSIVPVMIMGRIALKVTNIVSTPNPGLSRLYYVYGSGTYHASNSSVASSTVLGNILRTAKTGVTAGIISVGDLVEVQINKLLQV